MAGMLPGVECARRRRCHQGGGGGGTAESSSSLFHSFTGQSRTRRSSFCLYASNYDAHINTSSSLVQIYTLRNHHNFSSEHTQKLEGIAKEAKERLDERLRNQRKSSETIKRRSSKEIKKREKASAAADSCGSSATAAFVNGNNTVNQVGEEVSSETKKSSNNLKSLVCRGKSSGRWKLLLDQDECAVCLEQLATGENLMHLPCSHRYHSRCLVPWLESNAHCPCCRMPI